MDNPFAFSGKERLDSAGLSLYDFGARNFSVGNAPRWTTMDPLCEKYYSISPYAYCAGDPVNLVDPTGRWLLVKDWESIEAIYNGLAKGSRIVITVNDGIVDPSSFDSESDDFFVRDLFEISSNTSYIIELSVSDSYSHKTPQGIFPVYFPQPEDLNDFDFGDNFISILKDMGEPIGRHVQGNLGRSLFPVDSNSQSIDSNIHIVINAKGLLNHRTIGIAHELGHVILFLRGKPYQHNNKEVDEFVYGRSTMMSKRLGYDY